MKHLDKKRLASVNGGGAKDFGFLRRNTWLSVTKWRDPRLARLSCRCDIFTYPGNKYVKTEVFRGR